MTPFCRLRLVVGWWLVLVCCERKLLLNDWWLVLVCCESRCWFVVRVKHCWLAGEADSRTEPMFRGQSGLNYVIFTAVIVSAVPVML